MDNKIRVISFKQNSTEYLSTVLSFSLIDQLSEVLVYGDDPIGYQRKPNRSHFLKVKSYINENKEFKFPSAIILGADKTAVNSTYLRKDNCGEYLNLSNTNKRKIFRIVDGQHRIFGIREALKENPSLSELMLPVTIILSSENKKSIELEIFTQINSKAKRISTDLAELAKYNYQIIEKNISEKEIINHVSIKTAFKLKNITNNNVWSQGIKFDIHSEIVLGIVGLTMFCESIKNIVEGYVDKNQCNKLIKNEQKELLIKYCDEVADLIALKLNLVWNIDIKNKWPQGFRQNTVKDENGDLYDIFYNNEYYIQNTLGIKAINNILGDLIKVRGTEQSTFDTFKLIIQNSQVTFKEWKKGGLFSGLSSESGFGKVRKYIKNEIPLPKE